MGEGGEEERKPREAPGVVSVCAAEECALDARELGERERIGDKTGETAGSLFLVITPVDLLLCLLPESADCGDDRVRDGDG